MNHLDDFDCVHVPKCLNVRHNINKTIAVKDGMIQLVLAFLINLSIESEHVSLTEAKDFTGKKYFHLMNLM